MFGHSVIGEPSFVIVKGVGGVYLDGLGEFLNACKEISEEAFPPT